MFNRTGAVRGRSPQVGNPLLGGPRSAPFTRHATTTDSSFASTTVTLPRSAVPQGVQVSISALAGTVRVQGNGVEYYATAVSVNNKSYLTLPSFPETTSIVIQSKLAGAAYLTGSVDYT